MIHGWNTNKFQAKTKTRSTKKYKTAFMKHTMSIYNLAGSHMNITGKTCWSYLLPKDSRPHTQSFVWNHPSTKTKDTHGLKCSSLNLQGKEGPYGSQLANSPDKAWDKRQNTGSEWPVTAIMLSVQVFLHFSDFNHMEKALISPLNELLPQPRVPIDL